MLKATEPLQAQLFEEMKARIKEDDASVPPPTGPWSTTAASRTGAQHPRLRPRRIGRGAAEAGAGRRRRPGNGQQAYYDIGATDHTPGHALFGFAEDAQGSEYYIVRVKDLATGQLLPDPVTSSTATHLLARLQVEAVWTFRRRERPPTKIFRRPVRGAKSTTWLVYAGGRTRGMFIESAHRLTTASSSSARATRRPARRATSRFGPDAPRPGWSSRAARRACATTRPLGRPLVIRTNADGAVDFKLVTAPTDNPAKSAWTTGSP
jgi:oligopeptidase B